MSPQARAARFFN